MKMVKSLLLGTAAGLVAMTGAQAADLPVKAKPVQYVKICSLYGAGFYYIPGTDMCLKIGGWVRAEYTYGGNGSLAWGPFNNNVNNRVTNNSTWRSRGYITADARNQSEYGTIRSYIAVGLNDSDTTGAGPGFSGNRAFIQLAGFTFGLSSSFYDFYSVPATSFWGSFPSSDTGDPGWKVLAYTAQFGGGMSATISAEMRRMTQIINTNNPAGSTPAQYTPGAFPGGAGQYGGFNAPDLVANVRINQAWGSAQIMGALHQVNANYYGGAGAVASGHPDDAWGFAIGAGLKVLAPMIGAGDFFQAQVNYTEGASRYVMSTPNTNWGKVEGNIQSFGILSDAVFGGTIAGLNATDLQLTTGFGVNAAYEHFWNKQWKTSLYGGYASISYNGTAQSLIFNGNPASVPTAGFDMDWSTWWLGSRTQWNITRDTYFGVDVLYSKLNSASLPNGVCAGFIVCNANTQFVGDVDNWMGRFRVHRDFYP